MKLLCDAKRVDLTNTRFMIITCQVKFRPSKYCLPTRDVLFTGIARFKYLYRWYVFIREFPQDLTGALSKIWLRVICQERNRSSVLSNIRNGYWNQWWKPFFNKLGEFEGVSVVVIESLKLSLWEMQTLISKPQTITRTSSIRHVVVNNY